MFRQRYVVEYTIIYDHNIEDLIDKVQGFLDRENQNGSYWEPMGGCSAFGEGDRLLCVGQAMGRVVYRWFWQPQP